MDYLVLLETASKMRGIQNKFYKKISDETGLHYTALEIIIFLYDNPVNNTAKEICSLLNLKSNLVSFHVDKLVSNGFLAREYLDSDRRKIKLLVTEKCVNVAKRCNEIRTMLCEKFLFNCTKEELIAFFNFISKLNKNADSIEI